MYEPQHLQRNCRLLPNYTGTRWRDLLREKRSKLLAVIVGNLVFVCCILGLIVLFVVLPFGWKSWAVVAFLALSAYSLTRRVVWLFYYLFVGKRDIAQVLEGQIDHDRQRNFWP